LVPVAVGALVLAALCYAATVDIRLAAIMSGVVVVLLFMGLVLYHQARHAQALESLADDSAAELDSLRQSMAERLDALQRELDGRVAHLAEVEQRLLVARAEIADLRRRVAAADAATERLAAATLLPAIADHASPSVPGVEWAELWPDLADAPTVVDMVAWATPFADDHGNAAAAS
jgi:uncharacterized membrane-anchored protein YhcB (DUF1043 family)